MSRRGRKPKDQKINQSLVDCAFPKVIQMVEDGYTISDALNKLNIDRGLFYKLITTKQKLELKFIKTLNTKYGVGYYCR